MLVATYGSHVTWTKDDYTPLHVLCGRALEINPDMVKLLLQYGANVYAPTGVLTSCISFHSKPASKDFGMVPPLPEYTPLHLLCRRKQVDVHVVRMLLERGAPVDATIHASITHDKVVDAAGGLFIYITA